MGQNLEANPNNSNPQQQVYRNKIFYVGMKTCKRNEREG
jgi:hypothetical protein